MAEDGRPKWVNIHVQPQFESLEDVWLYIDARKNVLNQLVANNSGNIEVWVSFNNTVPLQQLDDIANKYSLRVTGFQGIAVDEEGKYLYTYGIGHSDENKPVDMEHILSWVKEEDEWYRSHYNVTTTFHRLNFVVATLPASQALLLQDDPSVLLVDPTSDLIQLFAGQASSIRVEAMPQCAFYVRQFTGE
jgi:hypothetical protein